MSRRLDKASRRERVTGIGGVFFKAKDPGKLMAWYKEHLGVVPAAEGENSSMFRWREHDDPEKEGYTVWAIFDHETKYFDPSAAPFMVNFRVDNLRAILDQLKREGVRVDDKVEEYDYGDFGWVTDSEGNRIELWEPKNPSKH